MTTIKQQHLKIQILLTDSHFIHLQIQYFSFNLIITKENKRVGTYTN